MSLLNTIHRCADVIARIPGIQQVIAQQQRSEFVANRDKNLFFGVYETWQEAESAAAGYGVAGYNNSASADLYLKRIRMDQHDYPALYWVSRSLREGMQSVFDVGGATGIKFFAFHDELALWPQVSWTVQDVPAMVAKGRAIVAATDPAPPLHFTDRFEDGNGADLLFASGVLQYLPNTLAELMSGFTKFPKRIVINTAAIHASHEYFTVNSIGTAFCPYRVQTQAGVVRSLGKLGYRLREAWSNPDKPLTIPGRPTHSLQNYAGFVFDLLPKS